MSKINTGNANREYKDRLFRFVFGAEENKAYLLSLCNAVSGTNYTDVDDIEITTLSDAIYIKMKNDISFLIDSQMNLFEHQSTFNPNMPIRGMEYFAELYGNYIKANGLNIYVNSLQRIPTPRYFVFYNGTEEQPDVVKLKLSDAFQIPDNSGEFEWTATMLNINYGHNQKLLEQCQPLYEYARFVDLVRDYSKTMNLKEAIDLAVEQVKEWKCIGGFLYRCKREVSVMLLTEFDQKSYDNGLIKVGVEKGREEERIKNIRNMFMLNFPPEVIAKTCEVSVDYVLDLKKRFAK
nr:hypothetical protein [uncultured Anaerobutyricum sp.]